MADPLGFSTKTYEDLARENGMETAEEYLTSAYNPKVTQYLRVSGFEIKCDGAAAAIVMPTEKAKALGLPAIEVLGTGAAAYEGALYNNEYQGTRDGAKAVYDLTGVSPDEIDLFMCNDFFLGGDITASEECGFIPRGEAWKYILEGRVAPSTPTAAAATSVTRTAHRAWPISTRPSSRCAARLAPPSAPRSPKPPSCAVSAAARTCAARFFAR